MTFDDIREIIYKYFLSNFNLCEVIFDNQKYEVNPLKQYAQLSIEEYKKEILEIGFNSCLVSGVLLINIYTPEGSGLSKNWKVIDELSTLFFNKKIDDLYFKGLDVSNDGFDETFFKFSVKIPFEGDFFSK